MHNVNLRYGDKIARFFRICCAILNRFYSVGFTETSRNVDFAKQARLRSLLDTNTFQEYLEQNGLIRLTRSWKREDGNSVIDFPKLSLAEIEKVTLGSFQLKIAKRYIQQHLKENGQFEIRIADGQEGFIRAQIHSRFSSRKHHNVFVKYDPMVSSSDTITGYYCTCKVGARVVGCCSHVATVSIVCISVFDINICLINNLFLNLGYPLVWPRTLH